VKNVADTAIVVSDVDEPASRAVTPSGRLLRGFRRPEAMTGSIVILFFVLVVLTGPLFLHYSPEAQSAASLAPPGARHFLGTDELGRDLLSRVIYGIRVDLIVGLIAVPVGGVIGIAIGLFTSTNSVADTVVQRSFDIVLAFTGMVLGLTIAALIGGGLFTVLLTVAIVNVPLFGRLVRTTVRTEMGKDYVTAARAIALPTRTILSRHILPNAIDPLLVQAGLSLSNAVFLEGAMSFIGLGVKPPDPSLGSVLRDSINFMTVSPLYAIAPMVVISLLVVAFNLISDGLNKTLLNA